MAKRVKRTVYVLGAGASFPYGFPLGIKLVDEIISEAKRISSAKRWATYEKFAKDLRDSSAESIDAYLRSRLTDLEELNIGKTLVAFSILKHENDASLYAQPEGSSRPWYRRFFNELDFLRDDFNGGQPLDIITFNYDRSLEYFLFNFIRAHQRPQSNTECFRILYSKFNILHVYGRLPYLHGEREFREGTMSQGFELPYGEFNPTYHEQIMADHACKRFMTIYEAKKEDAIKAEISEIYGRNDRVAFLGLSYHDLNMQLLQFPIALKRHRANRPVHVESIGTALNLGTVALNRISDRYNITLFSCDIASLFEDHLNLKEEIEEPDEDEIYGSSGTHGSGSGWMG